MTERFDRSLAHFEIFADGIVLRDVFLKSLRMPSSIARW